jgi:hypothetical protein
MSVKMKRIGHLINTVEENNFVRARMSLKRNYFALMGLFIHAEQGG